jgi:hypothetical protein
LPDAGPQRADHGEREEQGREGQQHVHRAHQQPVEAATEVAGHEADRAADDQRQRHRHHAGEQRHPRAVGDTGEDAAAELVRAEGMLQRGGLQPNA